MLPVYVIRWSCSKCGRRWRTEFQVYSEGRDEEHAPLTVCEACAGEPVATVKRLRAKHRRAKQSAMNGEAVTG